MEDRKLSQWGVRGISADLAERVSAAAKASGMTLGGWVTRALEAALSQETGRPLPERADLRAEVDQLKEEVRQLRMKHEVEMASILTHVADLESLPTIKRDIEEQKEKREQGREEVRKNAEWAAPKK